MIEKRGTIAIVSGGLDSSSMLWILESQGYNVREIISFNYNQRHLIELENAKRVVEEFNKQFSKNAPHLIVDIGNIGNIIAAGALTGQEEVPQSKYDVESQKVTIVPNRNAIMLNIAAGRAVTLKVQYIAYAAHSSDASVYPDCRPEFVDAMDKAIELANAWNPVHIYAPFINSSKTDIVKIATELNVPLKLTWSCYEGNSRPCLKCGTCLERTQAFTENQLIDPALSTTEWELALSVLKNKES